MTPIPIELYRTALLELLTGGIPHPDDPVNQRTIEELEGLVISHGLMMPIVILPTHYARSTIRETLGDQLVCACGQYWPCPEIEQDE